MTDHTEEDADGEYKRAIADLEAARRSVIDPEAAHGTIGDMEADE
jgi:hypothetical protein